MNNKRFGFLVRQNRNWKRYRQKVSISFFVLSFFALGLMSVYSNITSILFAENKIDIFEHNLEDVALYFQRYDKDLSNFILQIDKVADSYFAGDNIFIAQSQTLDEILTYIKTKKRYLTELGFGDYRPMFEFLIDGLSYKEDIYDLLGKNGERNYIIILQNTAEKRPNGGFFGSFGFVSIESGFIKNIEVIDSYYPNRIAPDIKLQSPERSHKFVPDKLIGFVSANKFGFTNIDGRNIKNLYNHIFNNPKTYQKKEEVIDPELFENTFNKKVNGVIFLRSDVMADMIPGLQARLRERQFINANTDILREKRKQEGTFTGDFSNKKQVYLDDINDFFKKNKLTMIKSLIKNFDVLTSNKYFSIYLDTENTKINRDGLVQFLSKNNFSNDYDSGYMYFRDSNESYNKIDTFVNKKIGVYDSKGELVLTGSNDMINLHSVSYIDPTTKTQTPGLKPGKYSIKIKYFLDVPKDYIQYIYQLEKKYGIKMTERELGILGLQPAKHYVTGEEKYRATRSTVYLPSGVTILDMVGDIDDKFQFSPSFAKGLYYSMKILDNEVEKGVRIDIEIK